MKEIINKFFEEKYYSISPTELCEQMNKHGSDKATANGGAGNYTKLYDFLFRETKESVKNLFEVGLGTNNTDVPSNMGPYGKPGASLRGWRDYFGNAEIYGADVDKRILFEEERIKTFFVDQYDENSIKNLWSKFKGIEFDIILDDGIHDMAWTENSGNVIFFKNSIHKLKKTGFFIIEDVACDHVGQVVSPKVHKFVEDVASGLYGGVEFVDLIKTPAFVHGGGFRNTQVILIRK